MSEFWLFEILTSESEVEAEAGVKTEARYNFFFYINGIFISLEANYILNNKDLLISVYAWRDIAKSDMIGASYKKIPRC